MQTFNFFFDENQLLPVELYMKLVYFCNIVNPQLRTTFYLLQT